MRSLTLATVALLALSVSAPGSANVLPIITDVRTASSGDTVRITYDIVDPDGDEMTVILGVAGTDVKIEAPHPAASGAIGPGVASGDGRVIVLVRSAFDGTLPEPLVPRLMAYDGTGLGAEMIHIASRGGPDFLIDKYEVTNEQFAAFVRSDGYEMMEYWLVDDGSIDIEETGWNYAGRFRWLAPRDWDPAQAAPWSTSETSNLASSPVVGVSWFEAYAYCKWAGRRLPSSGEWREAAGLLDAAYPWGENLQDGSVPPRYAPANVRFGFDKYECEGFTTDGHTYAAPVGSYSPAGDSPFGLADAIGNVWEWANDVVAVVDYGTFSCATRPLKGGSWATALSELDDPTKDLCPLYRIDNAGFRCCR